MPHTTLTVDEISEAFEFLSDWEQRYQFLVEMGEKLPALATKYQTEDHQVHGCMSKVWFIAKPDDADPSRMRLHGDSDTPVIKGLVALLIAHYSGLAPQQILALDADYVFDQLGLFDHLSPTRHVGVYAMVEKIKSLAVDFMHMHQDADTAPARAAVISPMPST